MQLIKGRTITFMLVNGIFLIVLNIVLMSIIGYLTLDSNANANSRLGAFLLSFFIPAFIVFMTPKMSELERMLRFGFGFMAYIILSLFRLKIPDIVLTGLGPCLIISLAVLFYGKVLLNKVQEK